MLGSIIGGALSLAGGLIGSKQQADAVGDANANNAALQREFAQKGIRWRVEDAKAAGIHPLFAIGAPPISASPSYVAGDTGSSIASGMASFGQDIGRAIDVTRTGAERVAAKMDALRLERGELENTLLRSQIAKLQAAPVPPMPSMVPTGLSPEAGVVVNPSDVSTGSSNSAARQPGQITTHQFTAPDRFGIGLVPSKDMKDRMDDDFIASALWHLQNRLIAPPPPKEGWYWNLFTQRYQPLPYYKGKWQSFND